MPEAPQALSGTVAGVVEDEVGQGLVIPAEAKRRAPLSSRPKRSGEPGRDGAIKSSLPDSRRAGPGDSRMPHGGLSESHGRRCRHPSPGSAQTGCPGGDRRRAHRPRSPLRCVGDDKRPRGALSSRKRRRRYPGRLREQRKMRLVTHQPTILPPAGVSSPRNKSNEEGAAENVYRKSIGHVSALTRDHGLGHEQHPASYQIGRKVRPQIAHPKNPPKFHIPILTVTT